MLMKTLLLSLLTLSALCADAAIINVPAQYSTIQIALDASLPGDTIAVSPGTYFENINFHGKNVFLTSMYYLNNDTSYISTTIINGSNPQFADTASCVLFVSGEDSTAVLQGFTLTGGAGTSWQDIHNLNFYREGGGIFIELSSPAIRHNIIINNHVINTTGVVSTGGGGIRMGDSNPTVQNNIIMYNESIYGPGIVMNYSGGIIRNNIIAGNSGGSNFYGGSGLWILDNLGTTPKIIENNTIINNSCAASNGTGGILVWGANYVTIKNNIVRDNTPAIQFKILSASPSITYNITSGTVGGTGNIFTDPLLDPQCTTPLLSSPAIDAGDSSAIYNDISASPGTAQFPSQGTERNDIGVTGGPYAAVMNCIGIVSSVAEQNAHPQPVVYPSPASDYIYLENIKGVSAIILTDLEGRCVRNNLVKNNASGMISVKNIPSGIYIVKIKQDNSWYSSKITVKH
jgi:hypothetical protein